MQRRDQYDAWACCLAYPDKAGVDFARSGMALLMAERVTGSDQLDLLGVLLAGHDTGKREEVYCRTFDGSDRQALELGWHLYGENYARGALLVRLRKLMRENGLLPEAELADHLGVVLGLVGRLEPDMADALVRQVVLPALDKLTDGLSDETCPYHGVVHGVRRFLQQEHAAEAEQVQGAHA